MTADTLLAFLCDRLNFVRGEDGTRYAFKTDGNGFAQWPISSTVFRDAVRRIAPIEFDSGFDAAFDAARDRLLTEPWESFDAHPVKPSIQRATKALIAVLEDAKAGTVTAVDVYPIGVLLGHIINVIHHVNT